MLMKTERAEPFTNEELKEVRKRILEEYKERGVKLTPHELKTLVAKEELVPLQNKARELAGTISGLTMLSFGGGQDSTALNLLHIHEAGFRRRYSGEHFIVVMSDTGDEHDYTYDHIEKTKALCASYDIPFFFIKAEDGYHAKSWQNLIEPQTRTKDSEYKKTTVQMGTKSCTLNLKIDPIYKWLDDYIIDWMGYKLKEDGHKDGIKRGDKQGIKKFAKENGKIRVIIGFAFNEETRAVSSKKVEIKDYTRLTPKGKPSDSWKKCIFRDFPLIDLKLDRPKCQELIKKYIGYVPLPSNCMRCPYMADQEFLWLHRFHPEKMQEWISWEENSEDLEKGVFLSETVRQRLERVLVEYADWTDEQLTEYKNSHGCEANSNSY